MGIKKEPGEKPGVCAYALVCMSYSRGSMRSISGMISSLSLRFMVVLSHLSAALISTRLMRHMMACVAMVL